MLNGNSQIIYRFIRNRKGNMMVKTKIIKNGTMIIAKTHADFLNLLFNKSNKGYMRCTYKLDDDTLIWFFRLNGKESKEGWTNTLITEEKIIEEYTKDPREKLISHKSFPTERRAIFNIVDSKSDGLRHYIFKGIYEVSGTDDKRIWNKVSDDLNNVNLSSDLNR